MTTTKEIPAECEVCSVTQLSLKAEIPAKSLVCYKTIWMCPACFKTEYDLTKQSEAEADQRVAASRNATVEQSRKIDESIQLKDDIFNANTMAIHELETAINADPTIENKSLALFTELDIRYKHLAAVMFDARQVITDAGNQQRAIHTYMNANANRLRAEEREKLKIQDFNYQPEVIKPAKIAKATSGKARSPKKGPSAKELKEMAAKYNVPMEAIRARMISKNEDLETAAKTIAEKMGLL